LLDHVAAGGANSTRRIFALRMIPSGGKAVVPPSVVKYAKRPESPGHGGQ
jgi:hypothetical protein